MTTEILERPRKGFKGNLRIRRAGTPVAYTEEQQLEYAKCMADPLHFIENHVKIKNVDFEDLILFKVRDYQKAMVDAILNNREVIIKLPRQAGKTMCLAAIILWHVLFIPNYSILVAAHKGDKSREILNVIKEMYEELPDFLQQGVDEWNKGNIKLENKSRIKSSATTASSARGDTYNMIYLDEFAFVQQHVAEAFVKSVMPTISSGKTTKTIITSTPQGLNLFHTMWKSAIKAKQENVPGYVPIEIKWNEVPGRDEEFRKKIIREFGQAYFDQEYGAEFLGSGSTLISGQKLMQLTWDRPLIQNEGGHVRIYKKPEKDHVYALCADVAEGLGGDSSAAVIVDVTTVPYDVVCVYQNNEVDEMTYAGIIYDLAKRYNDALVLVEANFGQLVGDVIFQDFEYENIVMTARGKDRQNVSGGFSKKSRPGVKMDGGTKRRGCSNLKLLIEQDQLMIRDEWIYNELCRFAVKGKTYAAEEGHDDLAMCLVLFGWMADQGYIKALTDTSARQAIAAQNRKRVEDEILPLGFVSNYSEELQMEDVPVSARPGDDSWLLGDGMGRRDGNSFKEFDDIFGMG